MFDKRIKTGQQWSGLIYQVLLTSSNKLVRSATELAPSDPKKPSNERVPYINMKLKATHNRKYSDIKIGDNVKI